MMTVCHTVGHMLLLLLGCILRETLLMEIEAKKASGKRAMQSKPQQMYADVTKQEAKK